MKTNEILRVAIPKGNKSISLLFRKLGYQLPDDFDDSRKYIVSVGRGMELILAKPIDIPTYVEYGAADMGFVGKEILLEGLTPTSHQHISEKRENKLK